MDIVVNRIYELKRKNWVYCVKITENKYIGIKLKALNEINEVLSCIERDDFSRFSYVSFYSGDVVASYNVAFNFSKYKGKIINNINSVKSLGFNTHNYENAPYYEKSKPKKKTTKVTKEQNIAKDKKIKTSKSIALEYSPIFTIFEYEYRNKTIYIYLVAKIKYPKRKNKLIGVLLNSNKEILRQAELIEERFLEIDSRDNLNTFGLRTVYFNQMGSEIVGNGENIHRQINKLERMEYISNHIENKVRSFLINNYYDIVPYGYIKCKYSSKLIPDIFLFADSEKKEKCFIRLKNNTVGYKYGKLYFKLDISSEESSLLRIPVKLISFFNPISKVHCSVSVLNPEICGEIVEYGNDNVVISSAIDEKLEQITKLCKLKMHYIDFFENIIRYRVHYRVYPYYNMLNKATYSDYIKTLKFVAERTMDLFINPEKLNDNTPENTYEQKNCESSADFSIARLSSFSETKGIFYTLKDESVIADAKFLHTIQGKYIKKFAYLPQNEMRCFFDVLVVDVDLKNQKLIFRHYKEKWKSVQVSIKVEEYLFSPLFEYDGLIKMFWIITSIVAEKIFESNEMDIGNKSLSKWQQKDERNTPLSNSVEIIDYNVKSTSDYKVIKYSDLKTRPTEIGMHYRRGHWHYYWYGQHNSPERHKELKWVEETIINRTVKNIIVMI